MKSIAHEYLAMLDEAAQIQGKERAAYEAQLAAKLMPYADNPAFQAFLEMKRVAKLGS
jgi:hypothetical protein